VPITAAGERTAKLVKGARLVVINDGPHAVGWTHAEEVNTELVNFLGKAAAKATTSSQQKQAVA
jgi:non-heme chloroperoxidase